jgi:pyridoxal phosphate enzyme (YggS family)
MAINLQAYAAIREELAPFNATLVAVSKTRPPEDILALYEAGHRDFGENYVQELIGKQSQLPKDIRWHFIGHLQTNKVKLVAPFVQLIHGVDSLRLLQEIGKQGQKLGRQLSCLLQVHIAREETKFGLDAGEVVEIMEGEGARTPGIKIEGLMGMATFTEDQVQVRSEFRGLKKLFDRFPSFSILSMGMSNDYRLAIAEGSTMVRLGTVLFGERAPA